jgi:hypothetical protein
MEIKKGNLNYDQSGRAYPDEPQIKENWECIWEFESKHYRLVGDNEHKEWELYLGEMINGWVEHHGHLDLDTDEQEIIDFYNKLNMCKTKNLEIKLESLDPTGVPTKTYGFNMEIIDDKECMRVERLILYVGDCVYRIDNKGFIIERLVPHE